MPTVGGLVGPYHLKGRTSDLAQGDEPNRRILGYVHAPPHCPSSADLHSMWCPLPSSARRCPARCILGRSSLQHPGSQGSICPSVNGLNARKGRGMRGRRQNAEVFMLYKFLGGFWWFGVRMVGGFGGCVLMAFGRRRHHPNITSCSGREEKVAMQGGTQRTGAAMRAVVLALLCMHVGAQTCRSDLVKWPSMQCSEPCPMIVSSAARCSLSTRSAIAQDFNGSSYCCFCVYTGEVSSSHPPIPIRRCADIAKYIFGLQTMTDGAVHSTTPISPQTQAAHQIRSSR